MEIKIEIPFIALVGVSGSGKSHFIDLLVKEFDFFQIPSVTTREKRESEVEGYDKFFISEYEFLARHQKHKLACVSQNYGNWYGTDIDFVKNAMSTKQKLVGQFTLDNLPEIKHLFNAFCVYILPHSITHSFEILENRNIDTAEKELRKRDMLKQHQKVNKIDNSIIDLIFTNYYNRESERVFIQNLHI